MQAVRATDVAMIFQDPGAYLNPVMTIGEQIAEAIGKRRSKDPKTRESVLAALRDVQIPEPARVASELSARAERRHAAARDDRIGVDPPPAPDRGGRADDGARCDGAASDPRAARRAADADQGLIDPDLPRPRGRQERLRPGLRHVCRPDRRARAGRRDIRSTRNIPMRRRWSIPFSTPGRRRGTFRCSRARRPTWWRRLTDADFIRAAVS